MISRISRNFGQVALDFVTLNIGNIPNHTFSMNSRECLVKTNGRLYNVAKMVAAASTGGFLKPPVEAAATTLATLYSDRELACGE